MAVEALRPANSANLVVFTFLANLFAEKYNWFAESGLPVSVQFNFYLTCFLFDPIYSFHLISCHLSYFLHQSRPPHLLRLSSTPHIGPLLIFPLILPLIFLLISLFIFLSVFFLYFLWWWKWAMIKKRIHVDFGKRKSLRRPWRSFSCVSYQSPLFSPANIAPRFSPRISGDVAFKYLSYIQSQSRLLCCWVKNFIGALYPSKICAK